MPNTREKLIELLVEAEEWADHKCDELECETCPVNKTKPNCVQQLMIDRLIANGVTVNEWISVKDRLPEQYKTVIGWDGHFMGEVEHHGNDFVWMDDDGFNDFADVTHWMPLPEPPEGE